MDPDQENSPQYLFVLLTRHRAATEGYWLRPDVAFVGLLQPFDGDEVSVAFLSFARVAEWCREMRPANLHVLGGPGEDTDRLRGALVDFARSDAVIQ